MEEIPPSRRYRPFSYRLYGLQEKQRQSGIPRLFLFSLELDAREHSFVSDYQP